MPDYLVFRLYGPMASWGDIAVGETRHGTAHPSKSAVMGMVAAALGIRRHEEEAHQALFDGYGFGVKVVSDGSSLQDYHTVQIPPQRRNVRHDTRREELAADVLDTVLSFREYRCDGVYLVALWSRTGAPPHSLERLAEALDRPRFTLYLGRKSCPPALPLSPRVVTRADLKTALDEPGEPENPFPPLPRELRSFRRPARYYWEETEHSGMTPPFQRAPRHDACASRRRWQFVPRTEYLRIDEEEARHVL